MIGRFRCTILILGSTILGGCGEVIEPFSVAQIDNTVSDESSFPLAVDIDSVGSYPGSTKSGAGYFYDHVLEYRVWLHPERGAADRANGGDYYLAFAQYEKAVDFSKQNAGAEPPLVLVRQLEWVNEPEPGRYIHEKGERITEWQPEWLHDSKRSEKSIETFIEHNRE